MSLLWQSLKTGIRGGGQSPNSTCCSVCGKSSAITDPYQKRDLETSTKSVLVMELQGKGRAGLETFCGMMGMLPPVSQRAYTTQNQKLFVASGEEREASFADAAAELRKDVPEDQVLDITVTCEGTWARREFQCLYGVVVVVSWKTGKVLDVEILSKHCQACATHHGMDTSSDEFLDWWEGHQASCEVNYCGSSSVMESTGTLAIWKWYVSKNKLRYTQIISDSDSKTFKLLSDQLPYGASNLASKHECVGHVQNRMGMALEKAKEKFVNERGERVRMRGKGRLTDTTIKLLAIMQSHQIQHR